MDPDRYQMKDLKRRVASLEAALDRTNARLRNLANAHSRVREHGVVTRAITAHLEETQSKPTSKK